MSELVLYYPADPGQLPAFETVCAEVLPELRRNSPTGCHPAGESGRSDDAFSGPVIEVAGVDGAGKTTLAAHLSGHYIAQGRITYVRSFHTWIRRWTTAVAATRGSRAEHFGLDAVEFATAVELMDRSQLLRRSAADGSLFVLDPYIFCSAAMSASYGVTNLAAIGRPTCPARRRTWSFT